MNQVISRSWFPIRRLHASERFPTTAFATSKKQFAEEMRQDLEQRWRYPGQDDPQTIAVMSAVFILLHDPASAGTQRLCAQLEPERPRRIQADPECAWRKPCTRSLREVVLTR